MLEKLIIGAIEAVALAIQMTREAAANTLEELAEKVRKGELIPDEAFAQAEEDLERFDDLREHLSGEDDQE